jgi:hypothetical protein
VLAGIPNVRGERLARSRFLAETLSPEGSPKKESVAQKFQTEEIKLLFVPAKVLGPAA